MPESSVKKKSIPKCVGMKMIMCICKYIRERNRKRINAWIWLILKTGSPCLHLSAPVCLSFLSSHFWQWNYSPCYHFLQFHSNQYSKVWAEVHQHVYNSFLWIEGSQVIVNFFFYLFPILFEVFKTTYTKKNCMKKTLKIFSLGKKSICLIYFHSKYKPSTIEFQSLITCPLPSRCSLALVL